MNKSLVYTGIGLAIILGLLGIIFPMPTTQTVKSLAGTVENFPDWFTAGAAFGIQSVNGISSSGSGIVNAGLSVDKFGNMTQSPTDFTELGALIQNAGVTTLSTSTALTANQFCSSGLVVIPNTVTTNITITIPSLATIATGNCAGGIFSGAFLQQQIVNLSNFDVTEQLATTTNMSLVFGQGTSAVLAPNHTWVNYGQFVNTSYVQGATAAGTTFQVSVIDTQAGTAANSAASTTSASALGGAWVGHIVMPAGSTTASASSTAIDSLSSLVNLTQELTTPIAGTTCNTTAATGTLVSNLYNASTTLTGFKFQVNSAPVTNPDCFEFTIDN